MENKPTDQKFLKELEKSADNIREYFQKFGAIGAADFIKQAAAWNFDSPQRPSQRNIIK